MEINPVISFICAITGLVFIALITIFYPEAYLISHTQLIKVRSLYTLIESTSEASQQMDDHDVLNYIRNIPSDYK